MAIVDFSDVLSFLNSPPSNDEDIIRQIQSAVENWVQKECRRNFEQTTYNLERYNGTGSKYLYLKNYPVSAVYLLSIGSRDAIKICNSNTGTIASASVTTTSLILFRDSSTDATLLFSTYLTLTTLIAAINTLGNGWSAAIIDSAFSSYKSSILVPRFGGNCINSNWVYLKIPEQPEDEFEVYENRGMVSLSRVYNFYTANEEYNSGFVFPLGNNNIFVSYTAGYAEADIPDDLKLGIMIFIKDIYQKRKDSSWNLKSFKIGPISYTYADNDFNIPLETKNLIKNYKRISI
jgi:hypothetical protein